MLHTPGLLADQPLLVPVFLILLYLLARAMARYRATVGKAIAVLTGGTLVPAFLLLTIYAFTGNGVWQDRADMVLYAGVFVAWTAVRLVDAVFAAALLLTEEAVIAFLMVVFLLVELVAAVAMPVVAGQAFLPAVAVFQLTAGMASIAAMYLWLQDGIGEPLDTVNAVLGVAGTMLFVNAVFAAGVLQADSVGVEEALAGMVVAPLMYMAGVAVMLVVFRPNFAPEKLAWIGGDRDASGSERSEREV